MGRGCGSTAGGWCRGSASAPAIHRLARRLGLAGTLHNASGLVQLDLHGDRRDLERFLHDLPAALPPGARLEPLEPRWLPAAPEFFPLPAESGPGPMNSAASGDPTEALVAGSGATRREDRNSAPSTGNADPSVEPTLDQPCSLAPRRIAAPGLTISAADPDPASPLTIGLIAPSLVADRAPCAACLRDLEDPGSRRCGDPFISCCACGPRYAIATATPWRRAHTTLAPFRPCPACAAEFADPDDRRFHAETISCPLCGPRLSLLVAAGEVEVEGSAAAAGVGAAGRAAAAGARGSGTAVGRVPAAGAGGLAAAGVAARAAAPAAGRRSAAAWGNVGGPPPGAGGATGLRPATAGAFRELLGPPPAPGRSASAHHAALIDAAVELLNDGRILALQGVGGFQLLVDAAYGPAVARLRQRKRRPAKPFALLVADPAWIAAELQSGSRVPGPGGPGFGASGSGVPGSGAAGPGACGSGASGSGVPGISASGSGAFGPESPGEAASPADTNTANISPPITISKGISPATTSPQGTHPDHASPEASSPEATQPEHPGTDRQALSPAALRELRSAAAPIVLLPRRSGRPDPYPGVAPGSPQLGVMLPASPLHWLLVRRFGRPLVCTSGNRSGEPLCTDPAEALQRLAGIADAVLCHNRPIARPLDDSLLQLIDGRACLLRRARGYAPEPLTPPLRLNSAPPAATSPAAPAPLPGSAQAAVPGCAPAAPAGSPASAPGALPTVEITAAATSSGSPAPLPGSAQATGPGCAPAAPAGFPASGRAADAALAPAAAQAANPAPAPARAPASAPARAATAASREAAQAAGPLGSFAHAPSTTSAVPPAAASAGGLIFALGGDLKCAPALASGERVWLAPHLGDLADPRIQGRLTAGLAELQARHYPPLQAIACDHHPAYRSHQLAASHAATTGTPLLTVQHHAAHALAVVAEHGLPTPLLAFCADGLGYGENSGEMSGAMSSAMSGAMSSEAAPDSRGEATRAASGGKSDRQPQPPLWGGELLGIGPQRIERLAALRPLPLVGGERACLEPRRVALGLLASAGPWALDHPGAARSLAAFQATDRALLLQLLGHGLHCPWTSSLGRLFDGVASLLGVCQRLSYEGEAALRLQGLASREGAWSEADRSGDGVAHPFPRAAAPAAGLEALPLGWIDWQPALAALLAERAAGVPRRISAARFHRGLADGLAALLTNAAAARNCRVVVLAGGCFQNALLLEALIRRLRQCGLEPHWAAAVPPNDGGLALGQLEAWRRASRHGASRDGGARRAAAPMGAGS